MLLLAPFAVLAPAAVFFWYHFHAPPNATIWLILEGSNLTEAWDFIRLDSLPVFLGMFLIGFFIFKSLRQTDGPFFKNAKLRWASSLLLLVPLQIFVKAKSLDQAEYQLGHHFSYSYPWNLLMSYQLAQSELRKFKNIHLKDDQSPVAIDPKGGPQTVVLVIGESARRDRHSLYGYGVPTNPHLEQEKALIKIPNAITLHPHTIASVPLILTGVDVAKGVEQVPWSIVQYFKKAGFKTFWFSNQASLGDEDSLLGYYGKSSDRSEFLQVHSHSLPWAHDGALLPLFKEALNETIEMNEEKNDNGKGKLKDHKGEQKKFIVLHLQGSHYGFKRRYPSEFETFPDAYDNTVLYTDFILSEVIQSLKEQKGSSSALIYLSDHGILLNQCGKEFSHFDSKESYEIPYLFWFSDRAKALPPSSPFWQNMKRPVTTQSVIYTALDIAGIRVKNEGADLHSLLRKTFNEDQRWVQTYSKSVNFDESENSDSCHLEPKH